MKNPLKISPENWIKERERGQFSFFLQRAVIFTLIFVPLCLLINFVLGFFNEEWKIHSVFVSATSSGIALAFSEWTSLESEYRKSRKRNEQKDYGKEEK